MNEKLFIANNDDIESGAFGVFKLKKINKDGCYSEDEVVPVYAGDDSLGSRLFGWGVACWIMNKCKENVMMIFSTRDEVILPGNVEGDELER